jgi:antitoxin Phd
VTLKPKSAWNLQDAKARLSELVDLAQAGKPQIILRRGVPAAAVISIQQYESLRPKKSLISFLLKSPLVGSEIELPRSQEHYVPPDHLFDNEHA